MISDYALEIKRSGFSVYEQFDVKTYSIVLVNLLLNTLFFYYYNLWKIQKRRKN